MPSALYVDVLIPMAVTESLRRRGLDVLTSQDDGTVTDDDERLLVRASESGRISAASIDSKSAWFKAR